VHFFVEIWVVLKLLISLNLLVPENMNGGGAQAYEQSLAVKREKS